MADWALYLDEAGVTDAHSLPLKNGETPIFTLAGVALPLARWREYDRQFLYLKREFFAAEIDRSSKIDSVWEIKGADLTAPRNSGSERNIAFTHRVLDLIASFGGTIFGVSVLKRVSNPTPKTTIYTKALQIIAERYAEFLREKSSSGLTILDSRMAHLKKGSGLDYTVADSYLSFIFGNREGQLLRQLIEAPLFADSGLTAGLQIADIVAALVYSNVYREKLAPGGANELGYKDYGHTRRFYSELRRSMFESEATHAGYRLFGLRTLDHREKPSAAVSQDTRADPSPDVADAN